MRLLLIAAIPGLVACSVAAPAGELSGRFGYLGEWDVTATLSEGKAGPFSTRSYEGPLRMKHIGTCRPGEAGEKSGHIRISIRPQVAGGQARYTAQLMLAGDACSVSGTLSQSAHTFVTCGGQGQIPLRLWLK